MKGTRLHELQSMPARPVSSRIGRMASCLALIAAGILAVASPMAAETNLPPHRPRFSDSFSYRLDTRPEGPWSIHVIHVRRSRTDFGFHAVLGGHGALGLGTLSGQMAAFPRALGRPIASVNGDYFVRDGRFAGDPEGLCITEGRLVSTPSEKSCFWVAPDGSFQMTNVISLLSVLCPDGTKTPAGLNEERKDRPVIYTADFGPGTPTVAGWEVVLESASAALAPGEVRTFSVAGVREGGGAPLSSSNLVVSFPEALQKLARGLSPGATVAIDTSTLPDLRGVRTAVGGGPALLRNGKPTVIESGEARHPRSAIGWNADEFILMQVDGRQPPISVGMTLSELARYFLDLGCTDAINLDGGGSSTLWAQGQVVNSPSEGSERPMANALVVVLEPRPAAK
jgi:Phosphodiester glycosidase